MAVAALVCGIIGFVSCCTILPGLLGVAFGAVALPAIRRGEVRGRGLAISGIILGLLGVALGVALWVVVAMSPSVSVLAGDALSDSQMKTLREIGAVRTDETVKLLYCDGLFSFREGGAVLTDQRIVRYTQAGGVKAWKLEDVEAIDFTQSPSFLEDSTFILENGDGELMTFGVTTTEGGDKRFQHALRLAVDKAREAIGQPPAAKALPQP